MFPKKSENKSAKASVFILSFPICSIALRNQDVHEQDSSPDKNVV